MKLSEELQHWRIERPDEWKMDDFIRKAKELEENEKWLDSLEYAGVNNWDGYEFAQELFNNRNL